MRKIEIEKQVIEEKIKLIEMHLQRLARMKKLSLEKLALPDNFAISSYNLRGALESTFNIRAHILSRIPGVRPIEYKEMALEMGKQKIVSIILLKSNYIKWQAIEID